MSSNSLFVPLTVCRTRRYTPWPYARRNVSHKNHVATVPAVDVEKARVAQNALIARRRLGWSSRISSHINHSLRLYHSIRTNDCLTCQITSREDTERSTSQPSVSTSKTRNQLCQIRDNPKRHSNSLWRKISQFGQEIRWQRAFANYAINGAVSYKSSRNYLRAMAVLPRVNIAHEVDPNEAQTFSEGTFVYANNNRRGANMIQTDSNTSSTFRLLTEEQAALLLNISPATLRTWRCKKSGPKYQKLGRCVRYLASEICEFITMNTVEAA